MNKVLVIDDSNMIRQQVCRALGGAGFQTIEACDGADALKKLAASPDTRLVFCDVNMPVMSGIEFLEELANGGQAKIPVIMLTTEGQPELIQKAKALGAKGWIVKPFKPDMLIAAARKLAGSA